MIGGALGHDDSDQMQVFKRCTNHRYNKPRSNQISNEISGDMDPMDNFIPMGI